MVRTPEGKMSDSRLQVSGLVKRFGGLAAINNVSFSTKPGEILGVIGPNGAGKSTLFNLITGTIPPTAGKVTYLGADVTAFKPEQMAALGVIRTFQSTTVFVDKTVRENLRIGNQFNRLGNPSDLLDIGRVKQVRAESGRIVQQVLEFIRLEEVADRLAGELAYGNQKLLGVGMALAAQPKQLLMDEPAAGLNPTETKNMGVLIKRMRDELGIDIVLVEHDMAMVTSICDRIVVINMGEVIAVGTPSEIQLNQAVIDAYLGVDLEFD